MGKNIPVLSVKGGVGKSTVCARLGLALRDKGFRVGFLDIDVTGANLPSALGMPEPFPHVRVDTARDKMLPVQFEGCEVFSLSFRIGKAALMWEGGEQKVSAFGKEFEMRGTGRFELVRHMLENVEFSDCDFLLVDCPPTTGDEVLSLIKNPKSIWGIVLVCQPTNLAVQDIERALNMIKVKRLPLIGLVGNMVEAVCPHCGHIYSPFIDAGIDLDAFCERHGIPYLASIPFLPNDTVLRLKFQGLADTVANAKPLEIWRKSFEKRMVEAVMDGLVKGAFRK